ncbi:cellulose binding domain-containing protein [Actinoplanes sp. NPDC051470]|uniref:cellulose binding domain-containing protein n=1 Tax=Actinoplanes sp. NPDC051470 TaxID=3157224 RepID=UPI00342328D4
MLVRRLFAAALLAAGLVMVVPSSASALGACTASYAVTGSWTGAFQAAVTVTAGSSPITGWTVRLTYPGAQTIQQSWNATVTTSGSVVTAANASYNGALPAGGTASFGFIGNGSSTTPTVACSTGAAEDPGTGTAVRIMPLGDSITGSPGCWRASLYNNLVAAGHEVDMVGTLPGDGCGVAYDGDNEGHGGYLATNIAGGSQLPPWLGATDPDIVIMHLGTNDVWSNRSPTEILAAFTTLLRQMRAQNPDVVLLVAQIIPMNPSNCAACGARTVALNQAIPSWAAQNTTAASPVRVVDQWTGFTTSTDTYDGVHPNDSGNAKIAARWLAALETVLP